MKPNELMLGDWVCQYSLKEYSIIKIEYGYQIEECVEHGYEPIPLTAEILEKNGFYLESYNGDAMRGNWWTRSDFVFPESRIDAVGRNLFKYEYVHQLQHALKLCGIEKEIEL